MPPRSLFPLSLASIAMSAMPVTFQANQAAKATEVNQNFAFLDSSLAKKANQSTVDALASSINAKADASLKDSIVNLRQSIKGMADQSSLDKFASSRTDTATFNAFQRQTETQLKTKQDALGFKPLNTTGGTISGSLEVEGGLVAKRGAFDSLDIPSGQFRAGIGTGSLYAINKGIPTDQPALTWSDDGSNASISAGKNSLSVVKGEGSPIFNDGTANWKIWHSGNLDSAGFAGGPYLKLNATATDSQVISSILNLTSTTSTFPSHYFSNLWSGSGADCYVHFYPRDFSQSKPTTLTNGNLRVWNGKGYNTLRIGGDGTVKWLAGSAAPVEIAHSGNLDELGVMTTKGGTISGNLHVTGSLKSKPNLPVADYVFEPDYKLPPLSEVEAFTKENKHLPEIPSASEMEKAGVDLTQLNLLLLKKVEELTLHAIAQQKEIEELKASVKAMDGR